MMALCRLGGSKVKPAAGNPHMSADYPPTHQQSYYCNAMCRLQIRSGILAMCTCFQELHEPTQELPYFAVSANQSKARQCCKVK